MATPIDIELLGGQLRLPSLPSVVARLAAVVDDPNVGAHELGELAGQDPAITARMICLANSGYYGLRRQVTSPEQAATVIGMRALRNVAMQVSVLRQYDHLRSIPDFDIDEVWAHMSLTARLAQRLAELAHRRLGLNPDDYFACGLLHDVGKVVLLDSRPEEYLECVRWARRTGITFHAAEEEHFGYSHVDVGATLAQQWHLPDSIATAIQFHHGPTTEILSHPHVGLIAIADQVAYRSGSSTFESAVGRFAELAQRLLGIERRGFDEVAALARAGGEIDSA